MPAMEQNELEQLCRSLYVYDEAAVRGAIEQAKDPDKAAQLIDQLQQELTKEGLGEAFAAVALAIALSEAKVEAAIPVLQGMSDAIGKSGGIVREAGVYALQRMGTPALLATMTHIENAADPKVRTNGYWLLHAAMDVDEPTRLAVQEFAFSRAKLELRQAQETRQGQLLRAALSISAVLGDQRVKPTLEELVAQAKSSGENEEAEDLGFLLEDLATGKRWDYEVDWRTDWPEQCEEWYGFLQEWQAEEANAANRKERIEAHAELAEEYRQALVQQGMSADPAAVAKEKLKDWLELAGRHELDLRKPDVMLTREVLMEHVPAELLGDRRYFEALPRLVEAFFVFLHNTGRVEDLKPYERLFKEARELLPERGLDRKRWGMRKLMLVVGKERGYDMGDGVQAMQFVQDLVGSITGEKPKKEPSEAPAEEYVEEHHDERVEPIRRTEPKVGRNDPCPCGSGKKYKKCCGK